MLWPSAHLERSRFESYPRDLAIFIPARGRSNIGVKQAAPGNYRTRCFADRSLPRLTPHNGATTYHALGRFPGAACLKKFAVVHAQKEISRGLLSTTQSGSPPSASQTHPASPYPSLSSLNAAPRYLSVSLGSIDSSDSDSRVISAARPHNQAPSLAAS